MKRWKECVLFSERFSFYPGFSSTEKINQLAKQANLHSINHSQCVQSIELSLSRVPCSLLFLFSLSLPSFVPFLSFHFSFQTNKQTNKEPFKSIASVEESIAIIAHSLRIILSLPLPLAQYTCRRSAARPLRTSPREPPDTLQKPDQFPQAQKPRSKTRCDLQGPAVPSRATLRTAR